MVAWQTTGRCLCQLTFSQRRCFNGTPDRHQNTTKAIGRPDTHVFYGVAGQCDRIKYRGFNAVLPALRNIIPWCLRVCRHGDLRKGILESFQLKHTITSIESECYARKDKPKGWLEQDTGNKCGRQLSNAFQAVQSGRLCYLSRDYEGGMIWQERLDFLALTPLGCTYTPNDEHHRPSAPW